VADRLLLLNHPLLANRGFGLPFATVRGMNILVMTNTFTPHLGGVARSIEAFVADYRRRGHHVLIVAPHYPNAPLHEAGVIRIPALQKFNGSDFSVRLPIPGLLRTAVARFRPDLVHSHHPFLLGDTALRVAAAWDVPLVFTYHTMYEYYTHYVLSDVPPLRRYVKTLAAGYANLCDCVFAPSESVAAILRDRNVIAPIEVVPTGIAVERFTRGSGTQIRQMAGIPPGAFVVGYAGRLAPEKNLDFLIQAVAGLLCNRTDAHFLVVGSGPSQAMIVRHFCRRRLASRLHMVGPCRGQDLVDAYHAMDLFAFGSCSETQGLVLLEAMAAGLPVVAVDAPGARDLVVDGENGSLLPPQQIDRFAAALTAMADSSVARRKAMAHEARRTAAKFDVRLCAEKALGLYAAVLSAHRPAGRSPVVEPRGAWDAAMRWLEGEWEVLANQARAARLAAVPRILSRWPGLGSMLHAWRRLRRWVNRAELGIRLLRLSTREGTANEPGLVMVQIDGLSHRQFQQALSHRRLPFLRRLIAQGHYEVQTMYSGLPASTPAVQGELFYGVRGAVPSFSFRDHQTGQVVRMFEPEHAARIESRIYSPGQGLLEGGSAYSNIYTGGAAEAHFCSSSLGWSDLLRYANPLAVGVFALWHIMSLLRIVGLMGVETVLAVVDLFRGMMSGREFRQELKFVVSRVAISILLRELVTVGATLDAARGLPVIHVNLLGYDEHSHRRGPSSAFAHWTLKGLDGCIRRIWQAARRSRRRNYQLWIYADHGQEHVVPYFRLTGRWVEDAVAAVFEGPEHPVVNQGDVPANGFQTQRSAWLQRLLRRPPASLQPSAVKHRSTPISVTVAAMGSVGQVYYGEKLSPQRRLDVARRLVAEASIPLVMTEAEGVVWAFTAAGRFRLPEEAASVVGPQHPFLASVAVDLTALCRHPDAGQFVLCGWRSDGMPVTFPLENGAHAGPGPEETCGFVLSPGGIAVPSGRRYLLPLDLRHAAMQALGRLATEEQPELRPECIVLGSS
jgi:glycosyltransferase involved in cell wall biosynthesis